MLNPFSGGTTVSRAVTGTTANVALPSLAGNQVRVLSGTGNTLAFIRFGSSTVEAATTDMPINPGTVEVFTIQPSMTHVAAIGTSGTTLYFTAGDGQ